MKCNTVLYITDIIWHNTIIMHAWIVWNRWLYSSLVKYMFSVSFTQDSVAGGFGTFCSYRSYDLALIIIRWASQDCMMHDALLLQAAPSVRSAQFTKPTKRPIAKAAQFPPRPTPETPPAPWTVKNQKLPKKCGNCFTHWRYFHHSTTEKQTKQ